MGSPLYFSKEEAKDGQRCNNYSEKQEASSLVSDVAYWSARKRFDYNGSSSRGQSSETMDFPLYCSKETKDGQMCNNYSGQQETSSLVSDVAYWSARKRFDYNGSSSRGQSSETMDFPLYCSKEEAKDGQRCNNYSEKQEASSLVTDVAYWSARKRFDYNGSSSGGQSSETMNFFKKNAKDEQRCNNYSEKQETSSLVSDVAYWSALKRFGSNGSSSRGQSSETMDFPLYCSKEAKDGQRCNNYSGQQETSSLVSDVAYWSALKRFVCNGSSSGGQSSETMNFFKKNAKDEQRCNNYSEKQETSSLVSDVAYWSALKRFGSNGSSSGGQSSVTTDFPLYFSKEAKDGQRCNNYSVQQETSSLVSDVAYLSARKRFGSNGSSSGGQSSETNDFPFHFFKEEAKEEQRYNNYSKKQETCSSISDISYWSARKRFDSNGSSSGGQSSETMDFPLHFSYQSLSDIWKTKNSSDSSTDESHELSPIALVNQPSSSFHFENSTNACSILGSRSIDIINDANETEEELLESAITEYQKVNMNDIITSDQFEDNERGSSTSRSLIKQSNETLQMCEPNPLQYCVPYNNIRLGNYRSQSDISIPFRSSIARELPQNVPNQVTTTSTINRNCSFCANNNESVNIYSTHNLRTYVNGRYVLTCPVLLKHVCEICGATGIYAHTRTHCPAFISYMGQKPKPLAKLMKDTPHDAAGRFRKNMP